MRHRIIRTFTGPFVLLAMDDASLRTSWLNRETNHLLKSSREDQLLQPDLADRLHRYFAGDETVDFDDVPLPSGGGEFQRRCWRACRRIPRGQTRSYAELASLAGSPQAARAAGQAMRHNMLPVIVPCHRVVGSGGHLHGFGGTTNLRSRALAIKRCLLEMEAALADQDQPVLPGLSAMPAPRRTSILATA
jgi:methylated-DNA-[protein]-cysteine S-methyltransferase